MDFLKLGQDQLESYGPHEKENRRVVILTVANDMEAHGYAMPPDIDSRNIRAIAQLACQRTGATFLGHLPYSTDSVGEIARNWSPWYLPFDEFVEKVEECASHLVRSLRFSPRKVFILIGHGGNRLLPNENERLSKTLRAPVEAFMPGFAEGFDLSGSEIGEALMRILLAGGEHAYIMEHSAAAYLGDIDERKLAEMNAVAERDPLEVLKRWPAVAGLGGYIEFGGPEFDPLREIEGLRLSVEDFKTRRMIVADRQLGKTIVEAIAGFVVQRIGE
jgi:creatinine amidohydrolase/Fe(II)-dependent formamide hydrolase-like protein